MMSDPVLPNLLLAGVAKCGTTSLFSYLAHHPDVCGATPKEPGYFLPVLYDEQMPPITKYYRCFRQCRSETFVMEGTARYFLGGALVAEAIREELGNIRVLLILRNPVDRLFSFYKFKKGSMELDNGLTLEQYVRRCEATSRSDLKKREYNQYLGIEEGLYARYLPQWFDVFGSSLRVVFFEQLRSDPRGLMRQLCGWLWIDSGAYDRAVFAAKNRSVDYRSALLHRVAVPMRRRLDGFWRRHLLLKRILRALYYGVNGKPFIDEISTQTRAHLVSVFRESNQEVRADLSERGYKDLPSWLAVDSDTEPQSKASNATVDGADG